jgi:bacillithiol biosynthesis cysteine-adding enzyme BshC
MVLIADNAALKKEMTAVFEDDLFRHTPAALVQQTAKQLAGQYHAQVNPRDVNLFYMNGNIRDRIIKSGEQFIVNNTGISFSAAAMLDELQRYPERFSPNVVLRGLYQETILPNVAFIGGGSEIAYWLELKDMFVYYNVPYPVLIQRNSFLIINKKMGQLVHKLDIPMEALFRDESQLLKDIVKARSSLQLSLEKEMQQLSGLYDHIRAVARPVDTTLMQHINALEVKALKALRNLEKKMLRAEKNKHTVLSTQLHTLKSGLFPNNTLQERVENILPYYALYGQSFIDMLYRFSPALGEKFGILLSHDL